MGLTVISSAAIAGAKDLQAISSKLTYHDRLQGRFTQTKELSFLSTPFISAGSFTLSTAQGLDWLVETPLQSRMIVKESVITLDGKPVKDRGVGQFMATIMQAFMTGDLQGVRKDFTVAGELSDDGSWRLTLRPKTLVLRTVLSHIDLAGDTFLQRIAIVELDETRTIIEFNKVVGTPLESQDGNAPGA